MDAQEALNALKIVENVIVSRLKDDPAGPGLSVGRKPNKYKIFGTNNEQLFFMKEVAYVVDESQGLQFTVIAKDAYEKRVFTTEKKDYGFLNCMRFFCCCFPGECCTLQVAAIPGRGVIRQRYGEEHEFILCTNSKPEGAFKVNRICEMEGWFKRIPQPEYEIMSFDEAKAKVGFIKKLGEGFGAGGNSYRIKFPKNSDIDSRMLILGTTILFDYLHYSFDPSSVTYSQVSQDPARQLLIPMPEESD